MPEFAVKWLRFSYVTILQISGSGDHVSDVSKVSLPPSSGNANTQTGGSQPLLLAPAVREPHLADRIDGLTETNPKAFGNPVVGSLVSGFFVEKQAEIAELRMDLRSVRQQLQSAEERLSSMTVKHAVAIEQLHSASDQRWLRNLALFVGSVLLGWTVDLFGKNEIGVAIAITFAAAVLVCGSIFWPNKSGHVGASE